MYSEKFMAFRKGMIAVWDYRVDLWGKFTETVFIGRFEKPLRVGEHEL